jgi:hypothetical protein
MDLACLANRVFPGMFSQLPGGNDGCKLYLSIISS